MATILVVDDSAVYREPIKAVLEHAGYETFCASDGAEALSVTAQRTFDLILLDINMPVMDGIKFLERRAESPRLARVPVLVLSEEADRARVLQVLKHGVCGYVLKSQFTCELILQRIAKALETKGVRSAAGPSASGEVDGPRVEAPAALAHQDPAARLRTLRPLLSRSEVMERVSACEHLKALSPTVAHVLKLTRNPQCSIEPVAKAIAQDHAIALKILKLGNSAVYTRGEPVDSVQKAVVRIGLERIRQAVTNISVVERFTGEGIDQFIDTYQFWEHAIATGLIAAELAHAQEPKKADTAFTMGLLHDVGRVIFAEQLGPLYVQVVHTARELALPLEQVESRMLLMNHADVMEQILQSWKFAKDLVLPIVNHHLSADNIRAQSASHLADTARLALANRLAHAMLLGSSGNDVVYPIDDLCRLLKVAPELLLRIASTAREQTDNVKFAMLSAGNAAAWTARRDFVRDRFGTPLSPLFVSLEPQFDAYRILCDQFVGPADEPPNIAVLHIPSSREKDEVLRRLRGKEREEGIADLPVLVLSPGAKADLRNELGNRPVRSVPTPLVQEVFISAVESLLGQAGQR